MRTTPCQQPFVQPLRFFALTVARLLIVVIAAASLAVVAAAAEYAVDEADQQAKRHSASALGVIRNPARYAAEKAKVQEYFANFYFPAMTHVGEDDLARLGNMRYDLFRKYLWATDNEQLQRDLTDIAFAATRKIVGASRPPYHPAVRYNAVLILGQLDQQYALEGANPRPPVPLPAATKLLITIVGAAVSDKPVPPPVTLGAIIGLERHARFHEGLAPEDVDAMTATLLKLVGREKPIQEMDRETYDWLRLETAGVLAELGSLGPKNEVHDAILKLVNDFRSLDDRAAAAALLAKLKFDGAKLDSKATVEPLIKLARDIGKAEGKRAEEFHESRLVGGGFGPRRPDAFMMTGNETRETFPRRHVLTRLVDLRTALRAARPAVTEEYQKKIDALLKAIDPAIKAAENKDTVEINLATAIRTMASAIDRETAPAEMSAEEKEKVF